MAWRDVKILGTQCRAVVQESSFRIAALIRFDVICFDSFRCDPIWFHAI